MTAQPYVASYTKNPGPGCTLDYSLDWASWLQHGEVITSATWTITPQQAAQVGDLSVQSGQVIGGITTAWLTGGVIQCQYIASCAVVTSMGRSDSRSIFLDIESR